MFTIHRTANIIAPLLKFMLLRKRESITAKVARKYNWDLKKGEQLFPKWRLRMTKEAAAKTNRSALKQVDFFIVFSFILRMI